MGEGCVDVCVHVQDGRDRVASLGQVLYDSLTDLAETYHTDLALLQISDHVATPRRTWDAATGDYHDSDFYKPPLSWGHLYNALHCMLHCTPRYQDQR